MEKVRPSTKAAFVLLSLAIVAGLLSAANTANAAPLTSTTAGSENPFVGNPSTTYDWTLTTASTSNLSRVTATVPAGTDCAARALLLNGDNSNNATTTDSAANSPSGDIDIRVKAAAFHWAPGAGTYQVLLAKANISYSYQFHVNPSGHLQLWTSDNGTSWTISNDSQAPIPAADGSAVWLRATRVLNNGSNSVTNFYTSADGSTWTQLGATVNDLPTTIYDSADNVEVGTNIGGSQNAFQGQIYDAELLAGVNGTQRLAFDAHNASVASPTTWSAATGETWTVNRTGSNLPADIGCVLAGTASGIPTSGATYLRLIDGVTAYVFSATSVSASVPLTLRISGFINTLVPGTYNSTLTTYDNSSPPTAVDSASAAQFVFHAFSASPSTSTSVQASDVRPAQSNVRYTLTASSIATSTTRCIKINFNTQSDHSGIKPSGMGVAAATINGASTWAASPASWSVTNNDLSGTVTLTFAAGATPIATTARTLVIDGISSPSNAGTDYAFVATFGSVDCIGSPLNTFSASFATTSGVEVSATVPPYLTFGVAGRASVCNGQSNTNFQTNATSTAISFGRLVASSAAGSAQDLSISTNAANGFTVLAATAGTTPNSFRDANGNFVADVIGTNASPGGPPTSGTDAFGYTSGDASTTFTPDKWAKLTNLGGPVLIGGSGVLTKSNCVGFAISIDADTPAGSYSTSVTYTAVPNF